MDIKPTLEKLRLNKDMFRISDFEETSPNCFVAHIYGVSDCNECFYQHPIVATSEEQKHESVLKALPEFLKDPKHCTRH